MEKITAMGWNVENLGKSKLKKEQGGVELIKFIAEVIKQKKADVVGISEIRSNRGEDIGKYLVDAIGGDWGYGASPKFCNGRWEQYLFVWNRTTIDTYDPNPPVGPFQFEFDSQDGKRIGFPRQKRKDRPPYLGYFQSKGQSNRKILVAIMHSPGPDSVKTPHKTAQALAKVAEFRTGGDTCVLLGDLNVKASVTASTPGTPGHDAFADLVGRPELLKQLLPDNEKSSLIATNKAFVGMTVQETLSQPYDQIFFRDSGQPGTSARVEDVITEAMARGNLEAHLAAIHRKIHGTVVDYSAVEHAFDAYRVYVSDHLPVVVEVHF